MNKDDSDFRQGQIDFANALRRLVKNLLKQKSKTRTRKNLSPTNPFFDESDNIDYPPLNIDILRVPPRRTEDVDLDGLSSEDSDDITPVIHTRPVPAEEVVLSDGNEKLTALYTCYFSELDNQYLPIRWSTLNENEIAEVVDYLRSGLDTESSLLERASQLVIALTLVTGQDLRSLLEFKIQNDGINSEDKNWLIREQDIYYWGHTLPQLTNAYKAQQKEIQYLNPVARSIVLPLPRTISQLFSKCLGQHHKTGFIRDVLNVDVESLEMNVQAQLAQLRSSRTNRSNLARIRNMLFQQLMHVNNDEIAALTIIGTEYERPLSGLYYTCFQIKNLVNHYQTAINQLFSSDEFAAYIKNYNQYLEAGSELSVLVETIQGLVNELRNRCKHSNAGTRNLEKIIRAHNDYTNYCVMMLLFSSAHRSVNDPFYSNSCFIPSKNIVLITDKMEMQEHEGRSVWLGDIAVSQYNAYVKHLDGLASAIKKYNPNLAGAVKNLTQPCLKQSLPFFFYLTQKGWTSIKPSRLKKQLGDAWHLPLNANRHFLATQLRRLDVPAEYIGYQLGHVRTGQLPHGQNSLLSPDDIGKRLIPALTQLEKLSGWKCVPGMRPYGKTDSLTEQKQSFFSDIAFGPVLRQNRRDASNKEDVKVVRQSIRKINKTNEWNDTQEIPEDYINQVINEISRNSSDTPSKLIRRRNIFRRFIKLGRHKKKWHSLVPSLAVEIKGEKAPLNSEDGTGIHKLNLIKQEFLRYIGQQFTDNIFPPDFSVDTVPQARYWASLRLSALLFGQLCDRTHMSQLDKNVSKNIQSHDGTMWINFTQLIHDKTILKFRWFPDELSSVLIIRLLQQIEATEPKFPIHSKINSSLETLIKQLCKTIGFKTSELGADPIEYIIKLVKKDNVLNFPGVVRAYLNGDVQSYPLNESSFRRLVTGRPLKLNESIANAGNTAICSSRIAKQRSTTLKKELEALKNLREHVSNAQSNSSGQQLDSNKIENDAQRRKAFGYNLEEWRNTWGNTCSLTMHFLYEWLCGLLENGTSQKKTLALGTIQQYFNTCSTAVIEQCWDVDLSDLDSDELFDMYDRVIDAGTRLNRPYRAARLAEFHRFLVLQHSAAVVEFDDLEPGCTEYGADATIIMPDEYEHAFKLLLDDEYLKPDEQMLHGLILCLTYRNGLRTGEVVRLLISDIISQNFTLTYIRNNRLGKAKSPNGIRQIPFYERLNETEIKLLQRWHQDRLASDPDDKLAPFFTQRLRDNAVVIRQKVTERITQALRIATGDPNVKFRTLRHSFATFFALGLAQQNDNFIDSSVIAKWTGYPEHHSENLTKNIFNQDVPTRKSMYQLAVLMGHGSPQTTIKNYVHCLDILTLVYRPAIPGQLTAQEIFTILGYKTNSMRPILARLNLSAKGIELKKMLPHFLNKNIPAKIKIPIASDHINSRVKLPPIPKTVDMPTFDVLANLLIDYSEGASINALSRHYFFETVRIEQWINTAIQVQKTSGYRRFKLQNRLENSGWPTRGNDQNVVGDIKPLRNNTHHIFSQKVYSALLNNDPDLYKLIDIWQKTYQRQSSGFYANNRNDLETLIKIITQYGIELNSIYLEIPMNAAEIYELYNDQLAEWFTNLNIPAENVRSITGNVYIESSDGLALQSHPGITVCTFQNEEEGFENYFSTEFISYYTFLVGTLILNRK